ncbi:lipopolysaccharide heptosyltransferase family protein [Enterobacter cloacae complex sp. 2022EL-00788]|uniref:glycosyltransferase family 9 protein n=1 Tax=Enterobacter cloacae complex sp. 2022EL-00788 TaxID=2996512 RepID=UPI00226F775B|nr:lipopolysaccharide heptosyltransferase family protein [Enterobacter cloacae complex sp. 2022EL-00788]MCY0775196.1 lipopolysaccharide heptosyltransferase family protein [Enterobacter cloacae complex sp. 2022EL-00788]
MIHWLKKLNRSRNHHFKIYKFKLRLQLACIFSNRNLIRLTQNNKKTRNIVIPFIGKGIGDAIVISGLVDILAENGFKVSVIADYKIYFLFESWTNLDNLFLYDSQQVQETIKNLRELGSFIFVDPHEITSSSIDTFNIIRRSKPVRTIGFNDNYSIYDEVVSITQPRGHVSGKCLDLLLHLTGKTPNSYDYVVRIPEKDKMEALHIIKGIGAKKIIAFVPYGSVSTRFFSDEQIRCILNYFSLHADNLHVIIIGEQSKIKGIKVEGNASINLASSFFTAAQLIKESCLVISPDTSIVHLSNVFNKRMVCFYPYKTVGDVADNADVWGPNYYNAVQVRLSDETLSDADADYIVSCIEGEVNKIVNFKGKQ